MYLSALRFETRCGCLGRSFLAEEFQELRRDRFIEVIERATGQRVIGYMSANQQAPDIMCEVFIVAPADLIDDHELATQRPIGLSRPDQ